MAAWNAAIIISGLLLIAVVGEIYLRLANPLIKTDIPAHFVDSVGVIPKPNAEVRYANWLDDNFVISITNNLGFLDREPVSAERAAASCHIAFIGDSYVMAKEVPIADKFHVRLEEMAARELPHLDITTQAYGQSGTGQINQIPFYDEYARHLSPKLLVLVFYLNDYTNNSPIRSALRGLDPDRLPFMSVQRDANGTLKLRPPDPEFERFLLPRLPTPWHLRAWQRMILVSYFAKWVDTKTFLFKRDDRPQTKAWWDIVSEYPCCASLMDGWQPADWGNVFKQIKEERLPLVLEEALEHTAFAIDQFKRRADRDGAHLAIMAATKTMGTRGDPQFDRLSAIAEARGIPVISDYAYIVDQGHDEQASRWPNDLHWNHTGHQWAAEAVLEWLKENQDVCD